MGSWTLGGRLGRGEGPGEKGKPSRHRVLLTNGSTVTPPHCPPKGRLTSKSPRGVRAESIPPPPRQGPKIKFRAATGIWDACPAEPEMDSGVQIPRGNPHTPCAPRTPPAKAPSAGALEVSARALLCHGRPKRLAWGWGRGIL